MARFLIAVAVAVFAVAFATGDLLGGLAGRRMRKVLAIVTVVSMCVAFRYAPGEASEIVLRPGRALRTWITAVTHRALQPTPTAPPSTKP